MTPLVHPSATAFGRLGLLALLLCLGTLGTGCQSTTPAEQIAIDNERKAWSTQYAWAVIKQEQNPNFAESATRWVANSAADGLGDVIEDADEDFTSELDLASGAQLPPGGVASLLESIRPKVAQAIASEGEFLQGNGIGLIVLGDLIGPNGQPLADSSQGEIQEFMNTLLTSEGLNERWYYVSMTEEKAEEVYRRGRATGGNATQNNGRTYVYNRENLLVLNLRINATPNATEHRVDYTGVGSVVAPTSGTPSGIEGAHIQLYYQPFMGEWITGEEERARRLRDPKE